MMTEGFELMMLNDENKKDLKKMMKGRAVYLALGVCVLAAGIVSYTSTLGKLSPRLHAAEETEVVTYLHADDRVLPETTTIPAEPPAATQKPAEAVSERTTLPPETAAPVFDNVSPPVPEAEAETQPPAAQTFRLPLSARLGDDYSMGVPVFSDTMGDYRTHNGVDFLGEAGEAVHAIGDGTVTEVSASPLYGNAVTVDHGGGIVSRICGLADEGLIGEGERVSADAVIGLVGRSPPRKKRGRTSIWRSAATARSRIRWSFLISRREKNKEGADALKSRKKERISEWFRDPFLFDRSGVGGGMALVEGRMN